MLVFVGPAKTSPGRAASNGKSVKAPLEIFSKLRDADTSWFSKE